MTRRGPSKIAERMVAILLPPSCREELLGDLHERYTSPWRYLADVVRTVPMVILSRIRRRLFAFLLTGRTDTVKSKIAIALMVVVLVCVASALWMAAASTELPAATLLVKSAPFLALLGLWMVLLIARRIWPGGRRS